MYDYENPVLKWVAMVILVLCILFAGFSVFTGIMGAQNSKAQMAQYNEDYKKIQAEIDKLEKKQKGLVSETISAQDLGSAIAKDQNVLSKYAKKMYDETISGEELDAVTDLMKNLSLKLNEPEIANGDQREMYFKHVWTKNPKAEVRFETVLKYYTDTIDCLFTIWEGENFYGYVTGSYDEQSGAIIETIVTFTPYGDKHEPVYKIEERNVEDPTAIVIPEGASYTEDQIKKLLAKSADERTEEDWAVLQQYWSDNNMEGENKPEQE